MIEIILAVITGVLTLITTFMGAKQIQRSNCNNNACCDIVLETEPHNNNNE